MMRLGRCWFGSFVFAASFVAACVSGARAAVAPSFQILATPPEWGSNVQATGVSADGAVVIGRYFRAGSDPTCQTFGGCTRAFRESWL